MRRIQSGCIQTLLNQSGKLVCYRLVLPVPYKYAALVQLVNILSTPNSKGTIRYFYTFESDNFEVIEQKKTACQLVVNTIKKEELEEKAQYLLNKLSSF